VLFAFAGHGGEFSESQNLESQNLEISGSGALFTQPFES